MCNSGRKYKLYLTILIGVKKKKKILQGMRTKPYAITGKTLQKKYERETITLDQ